MGRSRTALYFVLAFGITWGLQVPAILAWTGIIAPRRLYVGLAALGTFGPMLAAMVAARVEGAGIRALFRHLNNPGHLLPSRSAPFVLQMAAYVLIGIGLAMQLSRA